MATQPPDFIPDDAPDFISDEEAAKASTSPEAARVEIPNTTPPPPPSPPTITGQVRDYVRGAFPSPQGVVGMGKVVWEGRSPVSTISALADPKSNIRNLIDGTVAASGEQFSKAKEAATTGRPFAALGHTVAGAVPGVGPAVANLVERLRDNPQDASAWAELSGMLTSPLNFLPAASRLGRGTRAMEVAGNLEEKGLAGLVRGIAPDASKAEFATLLEKVPELHHTGTTRGAPSITTLQDRIAGVVDDTHTRIETRLATPGIGDAPDVSSAGNRAATARSLTRAQIPDIEGGSLTITPKEFVRLPAAQRRAILEGQNPAMVENLHNIKDFPNDPIDVDLHPGNIAAATPELRAENRALGGVLDEVAKSEVARGQLGPNADGMLTRRQAVILRRTLDRQSNKYAKLVPSSPGPATNAAALNQQANATRHAIGVADPTLGALNTRESAHLAAQSAIEDTITAIKAGGLRGEMWADIRGGASLGRASLGALAGGAGGGVKGAMIGAGTALTLPIAYRLVTSTPLRMLTANTRLAIAQAIVDGDFNAATRLAAVGLQGARGVDESTSITDRLAKAERDKNAAMMKGIE